MLAKQYLMSFILSFLGHPYIWGEMDCSRFVEEILKVDGRIPMDFNNSADSLYHYLLAHGYKKVHRLAYKRIVFYGQPTNITHVAYAVDGSNIVDAGGSGEKAMVRIRKFRKTNDLYRILGEK